MSEPEFSDMAMGLWTPKIQPRIRSEGTQRVELPAEHELLERLAVLSEELGARRCVSAYQLHAAADIPEVWEGELIDQRALIRRLLRYAGEDDRSFPTRLSDNRLAEAGDFADHLSGNLAYVGVGGPEQDTATFLVSALGDLRAMFGPTCVETARALLHRARIDAQARGYREGEALEGPGAELPSALDGFLACFVLGWGIPVTNACLDPRSVGNMRGELVGTAWIAASLSFPPEAAARLLAVIYRASARDEDELATRRAALNPSQREIFDLAYTELEGEGEALREILRWGRPGDWPPPAGPALDELEYDGHDEALATAQEAYTEQQRLPNLGGVVFRARPKWTVQGVIVGGLLGLVLAAAPGILIGGVLGGLIGSQLRRSVCSGPRCGAPLDADANQCERCGGKIVGEIARARDHLGALEDYERTQGALEVGEHS